MEEDTIVYDPVDSKPMKLSEVYAQNDGLYFGSLETQQMYYHMLERGFEVVTENGKPCLKPRQPEKLWSQEFNLRSTSKDGHFVKAKLEPGDYILSAEVPDLHSSITGARSSKIKFEVTSGVNAKQTLKGGEFSLEKTNPQRSERFTISDDAAGSNGATFTIDVSSNSILKSVRTVVSLEFLPLPQIKKELADARRLSKSLVKPNEYQVELTKGTTGVGMTLGWDKGINLCVVKTIDDNGPAARTQKLKKGDRILGIQGKRIQGHSFKDVIKALRNVPLTVVLIMQEAPQGYVIKNTNGKVRNLNGPKPVRPQRRSISRPPAPQRPRRPSGARTPPPVPGVPGKSPPPPVPRQAPPPPNRGPVPPVPEKRTSLRAPPTRQQPPPPVPVQQVAPPPVPTQQKAPPPPIPQQAPQIPVSVPPVPTPSQPPPAPAPRSAPPPPIPVQSQAGSRQGSARGSPPPPPTQRQAPPPVPTAPTASSSLAGYEKYEKMRHAGLPEGAIRNAMARDGVEPPAGFFADEAPAAPAIPSPAARQSPPAPPSQAAEPAPAGYEKYQKMKNSGLPEGAILNAMRRDGVEPPPGFFSDPEIAQESHKAAGPPAGGLMAQIGQGVQLKKATPGSSPPPAAPAGGGGMSLMDQLKAGKQLKKTDVDLSAPTPTPAAAPASNPLFDAIKKGQGQLRSVDPKEIEEQKRKSQVNSGGALGAIAAALDARREVIASDSDDEEWDDDDEWAM